MMPSFFDMLWALYECVKLCSKIYAVVPGKTRRILFLIMVAYGKIIGLLRPSRDMQNC